MRNEANFVAGLSKRLFRSVTDLTFVVFHSAHFTGVRGVGISCT